MSHLFIDSPAISQNWCFVSFNLIDALDDVPNYIATVDELAMANQQLNNIFDGKGKTTRQQFQTELEKNYLNETWFKNNNHSDQWETFKDAIATHDFNNTTYIAATNWLADTLRAKTHTISVKYEWIDNGTDGGTTFTSVFLPSGVVPQTKTVFISTGAAAEPVVYSEMAMELAKQGYRVVLVSDPSGFYSSGYLKKNGERTQGWGEVPFKKSFVDLTAKAWGKILEHYLGDNPPPFQLVSHSAGLLHVLSALKDLPENYKSKLKGRVDLAPTWELAPAAKFQSWAISEVLDNGRFPNINISLGGTKVFMNAIAARVPESMYKFRLFWNTGHAAHNSNGAIRLKQFMRERGDTYDALKSLKGKYNDIPQTMIVDSDDMYVDVRGAGDMLDLLGGNVDNTKVIVFGAGGAARKKIKEEDNLDDRYSIEWQPGLIGGGHALNSPHALSTLVEVIKNGFG